MTSGSPSLSTPQASTQLDMITVTAEPPPPPSFGDLPGDGSYGDPISGFHQINQQFADGQRAFSARMDAQSAQFTAQLQAQSDARAAQMQAQFEANMASVDAQRAAMFAQPPITGPLLPPSFAAATQAAPPPVAPGLLAFGTEGPAPAAPATPPADPGGPAPPALPVVAAAAAAAPPSAGFGASLGEGLMSAAEAIGGALPQASRILPWASGIGAFAYGLFGNTGSIPDEATETRQRLESEARMKALGLIPGDPMPGPAPDAAAPPAGIPPAGVPAPAIPADPGPVLGMPFGEVPAFVGIAPPPGLPDGAAFTPVPDGGFAPLPGFAPSAPTPDAEGFLPAPDFVPLPGLSATPLPFPGLPGLLPATPPPPVPGLAPLDPALAGPQFLPSTDVGGVRDAAVRAGAELREDGRAVYGQRTFDPLAAGGPITPMDYRNATIAAEGVAAVRQHLARFGEAPHNAAMVERLDRIARGEIPATEYDRRFYTHELRELDRYRAIGIPDDAEASYEAWNDAHTATLADFGLTDRDAAGKPNLYHPDVWPLLGF